MKIYIASIRWKMSSHKKWSVSWYGINGTKWMQCIFTYKCIFFIKIINVTVAYLSK